MTQAVARFESLGANGEFAVVQRRCGIRPKGVLACARDVGMADLVRLLAAEFADFCDPDELALAAPGVLLDRRYNVRLPAETVVAEPSDAALMDLFLRQRARIRALAAQTLARLAAADTIFVYASPTLPDLSLSRALHAALKNFGDNALLVVTPGDGPGVQCLEPQLFAGTISAFAGGDAVLAGIRVAEWETLCRATLRLHAPPRPARPQAAAAPPPAAQQPTPPAGAAERLAAALRLHRDGKLDAAAAAYQALLQADPGHADALHLLGLVADAQGQTERALDLIGQAIARKTSPRFLANQGLVLARLGRLDAAVAAYRQALARQPDYPEALNNLGLALAAQEKPEEAAASHRRAIELRPEFAEAHLNLGHALGLLGDLAGAEAALRKAFALKPALNPVPAPGGMPRLLCVAADGAVPGALYRCAHLAEAASAAGWDARWRALAEVREADLHGLSAVLFWRGELTGPVCRMVAYARASGIRVGLDLDDLIFEPDLARVGVIDGIRTVGTTETRVREQFSRVRALLQAADFAIASTAELAARMRRAGLPVWLLPNGFDAATLRTARSALRARRRGPPEEMLRIGYAGGTRTHQRDVAPIAPALAAVLRARPQARLVLFRAPGGGQPMLALEEFSELAELSDRIEWRDLVPLRDLPRELARFDINIAPVETGNPFAEAKSELKYFEAALAGVPTVASPTGPFRRAILDDRTGLLADTPAAWEAALLALLDDAPRRARLAQAAYHDAMWRFGPERRAMLVRGLLAELAGGATAAQAFAADFIRPPPPHATPAVPEAETILDSDDGQDSRVTVAVVCAPDAADAIRVLGSVREQGLADLDLVVIDAGADAAATARSASWLRGHAGRFHRIALLRLAPGADPAGAKNLGFAWAETPFVLPADPGKRLRPGAAEALLAAIERGRAAFATPAAPGGAARYEPRRLQSGGPPVAAAMVAKWAWAAAGGFGGDDSAGDPDFELLCRFAELGFSGVPVAEPLLHSGAGNAAVPPVPPEALRRRHPWLAAS